MVTVAVEPAGRFGIEQLTALVQLAPGVAVDTLVTVAHDPIASLIVTFVASEVPALRTSRVQEMAPPAVATAGPDLAIDRFAEPVTVVEAESVLFDGAASGVADEAVAELTRVDPTAAEEASWPTTVNVALPPTASVPAIQVTVAPAAVQAPELPVVTNDTPLGNVSTTVTVSAVEGPSLRTTTVQLAVPPAVIVAGPLLSSTRSARRTTMATPVALLFDGVSSAVVAVAVAVLYHAPAASVAARFTSTVICTVAPTGIDPSEHVTVVVTEQLPWVGVAAVAINPLGSGSVTVTPVATEGP
jgi:hypothetical protein